MQQFDDSVNRVLTNPYVSSVVLSFAIFYGSSLKPAELPWQVQSVLDSYAVKMFLVWLILTVNNTKPVYSAAVVLVLFGLVYIMNTQKGYLEEGFKISPAQIHRGCEETTVADLLAVFNNDRDLLLAQMELFNVPANVPLTDEYAPLIATHLINGGFAITGSCRLYSSGV